MGSKLFVGNLKFDTTREELESLFSQVGQVASVSLPVERETGRPRGFAFVEYAADEHAQEAIQRFNGFDLRGRQIRVNAAEDRPPRRTGFGGGGGYAGGGGGGGYSEPSYDDGGFGGGYGGGGGGGGKSKGSRRNLRGKKRSL